jgi:ComF family protein
MFTTHYLKKIHAWFFPHTCLLCQNPGNNNLDLCLGCLKELPILPQTCPRCAKTLSTIPGLICGNCLQSPPPYEKAFSLFSYEKPITKLIMELKFHERLVNANLLGQLMAHAIQNDWYQNQPLPELIIPVPLHPKRLQERGYNQAIELARPISKILKIPLNSAACRRSKHTLAQARLPAKSRAQNIKNAFTIHQDFSGRHVAVIDDVTTTGHSITEFTKTLKSAGNPKIDVWVCARAVHSK